MHSEDLRVDVAGVDAALRASEERLRQLIASASDAVVVMDTAGQVAYWNPSAERLFGWSASEAVGQRLSTLIVPPALRDRHEEGVARYLATRETRIIGGSVEVSAVRRDGTEFPVELSLWPLESSGELLFGAFIRDVTERHAAGEALRLQELRYRPVVENGSEGILVVRDGRIVFANPRIQRMVGLTLEQMQAEPFTTWIHPDDRAMVADRHVRRMRGEAVESQYSFRVHRGDGELLWVELSAVSIAWDGQPATLSFLTDITERKRLEESLHQSLLERETILENSIVGILFLGPDARVRWANAALCHMFRVSRDAATGLSTEAFYPTPEAYAATEAAFADAVRSGQGFETEMEMRRSDGESFWVYASGRALDRGDLLQGTVWALIDITPRKALERALRRKTDEQAAILDSTLIGISLIAEQRFQWVNPTLTEMTGYPAETLIGSDAGILFFEAATWRAFLVDVLGKLEAHGRYAGEHVLRRASGEAIWVQLNGTRLASEDGESRSSLWTFVDVTERRRAEEEVRRALEAEQELSRLKSRFVAMTSHEFRTPLTGILSSVDLLDHYGGRLPEEEKAELLRQVRDSVGRMTRMLDRVLLIGRAEARGLEFRPAAMDLAALCREVAEEVTRSRPGGGGRPTLTLRTEVAEGELVLDATLVRQIVGNLLSNAFKYSPAGGEVRFEVSVGEGEARFTVSDQGIGIPAADQARLFESFHRAGNVGSIEGSGLGLAIVKQSVELHGGRIALSSEEGRGTRFDVAIPLGRALEA
jgi:PAS domain S-box-containing protein